MASGNEAPESAPGERKPPPLTGRQEEIGPTEKHETAETTSRAIGKTGSMAHRPERAIGEALPGYGGRAGSEYSPSSESTRSRRQPSDGMQKLSKRKDGPKTDDPKPKRAKSLEQQALGKEDIRRR